MSSLESLLHQIRSCSICTAHLPLGSRPVLQISGSAQILIVGQAPGRKVHETGIPFNDASGDRLRSWLGMSREEFYDHHKVAILPMGFCFPGTGKSGDLPPRPECAATWRASLLSHLKNIKLTLVIGRYAMAYHLPDEQGTLTETVQAWQKHWPEIVPLPHPSPRNNLWLKRNPWFEQEILPVLQQRVANILENQ